MKEKIVAILVYPYLDKYVVKVCRQLDRFHVPAERIYSARYTDVDKVFQLMNHYIDINAGLQIKILTERISYWKKEKANE